MHTITLKVDDSIYGHIIYLLKNLNDGHVEIIEDKNELKRQNIKQSLKQLLKDNKIKAFESIDDPLVWQKHQRDEW